MADNRTALVFAALGAITVAVGIVSWLWAAARTRTRLRAAMHDSERALHDGEGRLAAADAALAELRQRLVAANAEVSSWQERTMAADRAAAAEQARVEQLTIAIDDKQRLLHDAETRLTDTFKALAADALAANNLSFRDNFLSLAGEKLSAAHQASSSDLDKRQLAIETVLAPVRESLARVDEKIAQLEQDRQQAYGRLTAQVENMAGTQQRLHGETANLVKALRSPSARGRWGEIQLKRVVEIAGMLEHCDFAQQVTLATDDGRQRPDLVVRLPGGRQVVVDAKVPLEAYLDATQADDEDVRQRRLVDHAAQLRSHVQKLGAKSYWEQLPGTPEFVVLFLPGDAFYSAALEAAPSLIEEAAQKRVLIATPTTLIAVLQAVHVGWREERLAENAQKISEQGRLLHKSVVTFADHWGQLGRTLGRAVEHYNSAVGSLETRVLPVARRLEDMGAGSAKGLPEQLTLTTRPRLVAALDGRDSDAPAESESGRDVDDGDAGDVPDEADNPRSADAVTAILPAG